MRLGAIYVLNLYEVLQFNINLVGEGYYIIMNSANNWEYKNYIIEKL